MIEFTNYVGTSPGTTTMEIPAMNGLGQCPPGYYGAEIMLPGAVTSFPAAAAQGSLVTANPYGTDSKLSGLRGLGAVRWDLLMLAFGLTFAGFLGFALYKRRKRR